MQNRIKTQNGWLDIFVNPNDHEKSALLKDYWIDEHTLHSALDPDEPSRVELNDRYLAIIFKSPQKYRPRHKYLFGVASIGLFLYKDKIALISTENMDLEGLNIETNSGKLEDLFLNILLSSVHHYHSHLKIMIEITEEIEKQIMTSSENKQLSSLFAIEKSLVFYVYALESNGFALDKLKTISERNLLLNEYISTIEDLVIENTQCSRQAEIYSNILANLMDARVSLVSNNLNVLMKTLNVVTICIMIPTLIVSIFSMNIMLPFENHPKAFWLVLLLSVLSVMGVLLWWQWVLIRLKKRVF